MTCIAQISLEPVFGWVFVIPLAVIMLASLWLTFSTGGVSLRGRLVLMLLRLLAVGVLLLGWIRPGFISSSERESAGAIAVLMDRSESMTLAADSASESRWEVQQDVWNAIESQTDLSLGQTKIVPYFYDSQVSIAPADDLPALSNAFSKSPAGRITDVGKALREIGRQQLDPPLRGVILVGDAAQTAVPADVDPSVAARQMAQLDQPILLVGIGPKGEKSQVRDVAIEGVPEHYAAFVKKELSIRMVVSAQGVQNQPIKIKLRLRRGNQEQIVATREILASRASEKLPIEFTIELGEEGEYLLETVAEVDVREQVKTNNTALSFITVREGGVKILYLEGQPRPEQLFLKRSLNESLDFDVTYAWFPERTRKTEWPIDITRTVSVDEYDAVILGDLDASALSTSAAQQIASRVRDGGGLLLMGGYHSFDAGGYGRGSGRGPHPLEPAFPVELGNRSQAFDSPINPDLHILRSVSLVPTRPHPITNLVPEPRNSELWRRLTLPKGMNRLGEVRSAPGVQVLLRSTDGDPALVTGQFGRGRVLAFAGDETWRWALGGQNTVHQQFWRQALLWLIRRDSLNEGFRLDLDRRRLLIDETPDLAIEWFGGSENKAMPQSAEIELFRDGVLVQKLPMVAASDNRAKARIVGLDKPGLYKATLSSTSTDGEQYDSEIAFIVLDESRELSQPAADWQMMANIVSANQTAGGKLVLPENIGEAIAWLRERQEATKVTTIEKRRLGDAAWDAWLYLVLFCVILSTEWALRKSWQLP